MLLKYVCTNIKLGTNSLCLKNLYNQIQFQIKFRLIEFGMHVLCYDVLCDDTIFPLLSSILAPNTFCTVYCEVMGSSACFNASFMSYIYLSSFLVSSVVINVPHNIRSNYNLLNNLRH